MKRELNCIKVSSWIHQSKVLHVVHIVSQGFSNATVNGDLVVMRTQACIYSKALMLLLNTPELGDAIPGCGCLHCAGLQSGPAVCCHLSRWSLSAAGGKSLQTRIVTTDYDTQGVPKKCEGLATARLWWRCV